MYCRNTCNQLSFHIIFTEEQTFAATTAYTENEDL